MTRSRLPARVLGVVLAVSALFVQPAEARRGGSFGSRGSRTYMSPGYSSGYVAPIQRSMTTRPANAPAYAPQYAPQYAPAPGGNRFGGFGRGMLGGLLAGGLIGGLLGHGFGGGGFGGGLGGGGGGFLLGLIQLALIGGAIWFVIGLFRRNSGGVAASPVAPGMTASPFAGFQQPAAADPQAAPFTQKLVIDNADKAQFERLLGEVQDAFGHEDYARLRERTTPEVMSYLAEELSQNATNGLRNEVTATRLIDAQVAEAWQEGVADYATVALHYESIDVMHDRHSGAIVQGDPTRPSETTELWTFIRDGAAPWKLSAIQEV